MRRDGSVCGGAIYKWGGGGGDGDGGDGVKTAFMGTVLDSWGGSMNGNRSRLSAIIMLLFFFFS
jgi:hypothetical protein